MPVWIFIFGAIAFWLGLKLVKGPKGIEQHPQFFVFIITAIGLLAGVAVGLVLGTSIAPTNWEETKTDKLRGLGQGVYIEIYPKLSDSYSSPFVFRVESSDNSPGLLLSPRDDVKIIQEERPNGLITTSISRFDPLTYWWAFETRTIRYEIRIPIGSVRETTFYR